MISRLRGVVKEKGPTRLVLECAGIGFELWIPLSTARELPEPEHDAEVLVEPRQARDGLVLYGFAAARERDVFRLLTSVSGVGPKAGLNLLSRFTATEIVQFIQQRRADVLRTVPGLGPKKVESILTQLESTTPGPAPSSSLTADAESALQNLGLTRKEARERLARVVMTDEMTLQELLRLALAQRG
ncbi:Holliday junction branch migration protein RuvA [candidate division WOR-3 bacterium]|nr:Holliday junction branch migration protein RuvA [candidate division WOR-3 bacterium]